ncbi:hypothetical protein TNCT_648791 [Trichonephila clavata]|uniref:Uncharacterized protein n=1 Tax=Trichonephila clavata TaxID=2740835 RepID=A0A8X6HGX0_TRICU|nr:hypothetical protein TNCT_648791 [Trichonephila clavata]
MYFKVGYPIKVETTSVKNLISNYTSAHSVSPTGGLADVTECDFDLNQLPENAKEVNFSFYYCKKKQQCTIEFISPEKQFHIGPQLEWTLHFRWFKVVFVNGDEGYVLHLGKRSTKDLTHNLNAPPVLLK